MSELSDIEVTSTEPSPDPSQALVEAREKLGLSQKEVADKLFLTITVIKQIDQGEFDRLPRQAFIRGYLRSYARVVSLSGDRIVELYEKKSQSSAVTAQVRVITEERMGSAYITGPVALTGVVGLGLLFILIGLIWWLVMDEKPEVLIDQPMIEGQQLQSDKPPASEPVVETREVSQSVEEIAEEEIKGNVETDGPGKNQFGESTWVDASTSELQGEPESKTAPLGEAAHAYVSTDLISIERNLDGERNYITVDAGGLEELSLTFSEDCWVEVSDNQHGRVYYDLNHERDVLTVFGSLPFQVLLGKASGVEMLYNGVPFDLEPYIGPDKTAKIKITE